MVSKIANVERRGQFILNRLYMTGTTSISDYLNYVSNFDLDHILIRYRNYLIGEGVCPSCYNDLEAPDAQVETSHCHKCNWNTEHLLYTK